MTKLTRSEIAIAVAAGMLLGSAISVVGYLVLLNWPAKAALAVIGCAGLGALLACRKHGTR